MGKTYDFDPDDDPDDTPNDAISRAARARSGSPFLSNAQAAFYIGLHWRTLENMRSRGEGPRARKHGRYVRYHIDDLDAWSRSHDRKPRRDAASNGPDTGPDTGPENQKGGSDA